MRPAPGELRTHVCVASAANPVACVAACHTFVCCVASVAHTQEADVFHTADCITATRVRTRTPPEMLKALHCTRAERFWLVGEQSLTKTAASAKALTICSQEAEHPTPPIPAPLGVSLHFSKTSLLCSHAGLDDGSGGGGAELQDLVHPEMDSLNDVPAVVENPPYVFRVDGTGEMGIAVVSRVLFRIRS